jgi:hypothetical protein
MWTNPTARSFPSLKYTRFVKKTYIGRPNHESLSYQKAFFKALSGYRCDSSAHGEVTFSKNIELLDQPLSESLKYPNDAVAVKCP